MKYKSALGPQWAAYPREEASSNYFWLRMSVVLLLTVVILNRASTTAADPDFWGYMCFGRLFLSEGSFPYQDVFAYTPTHLVWMHHDWLTGTLFYALYSVFGFTVLQIVKYTIACLSLWVIYSTARRRGADASVSAIVILMIVQGWFFFGYSPVRAQVFTYFFFSLTLYVLERNRIDRHWKYLWLLVPIHAVWCNMHGGFLAGLGIISLYALGAWRERRRFLQLIAYLLLSASATALNPYGLKYWHFVIMAATMPRPELWEWASLPAAYMNGYVAWKEVLNLLAMIVLGLFLLWRNRWRDTVACLVLSVTLYIGLKNIRHLVFFYIVAGAYFPSMLMHYLEGMRHDFAELFARMSQELPMKVFVLAIVVITILLSINFLKSSPFSIKIAAEPTIGVIGTPYYPVGAAGYIQEHNLSGKLLGEYGWGTYLSWVLYPQCKVAIDPRYETVYPDEVSQKYFDFINARPNYRQFLQDYPPDMILIPPFLPVYELIKQEKDWQEIYKDSGSALFARR